MSYFYNVFQADNIAEQGRASAFGILSGVISAAWVCGTLVARLLSTDSTFQVSISHQTNQPFFLMVQLG